ncbi:MAG: addiction module protein [Dehalococcoidia bacterium]
MTKFESVLSQALELDEDERQMLALRLEASLGEERDPGYDAAWEAEIKRRVDELERGEVELVEWEEVRRDLMNPIQE